MLDNIIYTKTKEIFLDNSINGVIKEFENSIVSAYKLSIHIVVLLFNLKNMWGKQQKTNKNTYYFSSYILNNFGLSNNYATRLCRVAERFCNIPEKKIKDIFFGFDLTKLIELLVLSDRQIEFAIENKFLCYTMTIKQIREYIKSLKEDTSVQKVLEDTINSNKEELKSVVVGVLRLYTIEELKRKNKEELINIILELQEKIK